MDVVVTYITIQYITLQYNTIQYNTIHLKPYMVLSIGGSGTF